MVLRIDRTHHQVADQADEQQPGHDVQREIVLMRLRHAVVRLILADVADERGSEHAGGRPRSEQPAVDRAHLPVPKRSRRYAGIVANPPPYIVRITKQQNTKSATLRIRPLSGIRMYMSGPSVKNARYVALRPM